MTTPFHSAYWAHQLTLRSSSDSMENLSRSFKGVADAYPNLTLKKIPQSVLARCEWGNDDYSLKIQNLPSAPDLGAASPEPAPAPESGGVTRRRGRPAKAAKPSEGQQALGLEGLGDSPLVDDGEGRS